MTDINILLQEGLNKLDSMSKEELRIMFIEGGYSALDKLIPLEEEWINNAIDRREGLGKRMNEQKLECPECKTRQVQLIGYLNIKPAEWRCRRCRYHFSWEGE